jgi:hypothetical protein
MIREKRRFIGHLNLEFEAYSAIVGLLLKGIKCILMGLKWSHPGRFACGRCNPGMEQGSYPQDKIAQPKEIPL